MARRVYSVRGVSLLFSFAGLGVEGGDVRGDGPWRISMVWFLVRGCAHF